MAWYVILLLVLALICLIVIVIALAIIALTDEDDVEHNRRKRLEQIQLDTHAQRVIALAKAGRSVRPFTELLAYKYGRSHLAAVAERAVELEPCLIITEFN